MDCNIYSFVCPISHTKKKGNNKNYCLCSLALTTLPHQWQFTWEFGKMWLQGGVTSLLCLLWTASWKSINTAFHNLQKNCFQIMKNQPRRLKTSSLSDNAIVPCTHNVTQDQPQLNRKHLCQICVECQKGSCVCQLEWSLDLEYHKPLY